MRPLSCWLGHHDWMRAHEPHRIFLRCEVCGATTPGWRDDYEDLARPRVIHATPKRRPFKVLRARARRTA
jgi:hypothetical protein